jgi:hypothetical protein
MQRHQVASFHVSSNEIAAVIARYRASGLGLRAFALKEGLPAGRLHYWVYQKPAKATGRGPTQRRPAALAPVFREVRLPSGPEGNCRWAAELSLPEGVVVRFSAGASAQWIGSVVQALARPC